MQNRIGRSVRVRKVKVTPTLLNTISLQYTNLIRNHQLRNAISIAQQHELVKALELNPSQQFHFSTGIRLSQLATCMAPHSKRVGVSDAYRRYGTKKEDIISPLMRLDV